MPYKLSWLENYRILLKIISVNLIILLVAFLAIVFYIIPLYEQNLLWQYKSNTSNMVDIATTVLSDYNLKVQRHEMTLEEAQAGAIEFVRIMVSRNDYLWIHDLNAVMVFHPFGAQLVGKNLEDMKDASGKKLFVEMNQLVKAQGQGFLEYLWPKWAHEKPVAKISYIKLFEPWGWVVGSGIYYDDIRQESAELRNRVFMTSSILLVLIISFSLYAARRINLPLKKALQITHQISNPHVPTSKPGDVSGEPNLLLRSIEAIVTELKYAKDEAERANLAKSDFLAVMSHEIRTPLNAVVGMTELAVENAASPEQREYLEGILSSADHLLELINDILDFSKIEAGRVVLESIPFSLRDILQGATRPLAVRARQKGLDFDLTILPDVSDGLLGDPLRFRQVVTNLVGNAIKFTENGHVSVLVEERHADTERVALAITVRDTGIGIPADRQERIFDSFSQVDSSTTRKYGGTGLGLSIVKQLVEMMDGEITVKSEPEQGSEFCVSICFGRSPLPENSNKAGIPECPAVVPISVPSGDGGRQLSVLVAEDVQINQTIITRFIEGLGHRVTIAVNGREAVERWTEAVFDLILMDLQMPEMDGFEATRIIREQETSRGGHTPIIALTANVMSDDIGRCLKAGMDGHLAKPLKRVALAETLTQFTGVQVSIEG